MPLQGAICASLFVRELGRGHLVIAIVTTKSNAISVNALSTSDENYKSNRMAIFLF